VLSEPDFRDGERGEIGCERVTSIGWPNEMAVARVSFWMISTSRPAGRVARTPAGAPRDGPAESFASSVLTRARSSFGASPETPAVSAARV